MKPLEIETSTPDGRPVVCTFDGLNPIPLGAYTDWLAAVAALADGDRGTALIASLFDNACTGVTVAGEAASVADLGYMLKQRVMHSVLDAADAPVKVRGQ